MSNNTEPQAFPSNQNGLGMTLRDYFAAKAMQAFLNDNELVDMFVYLEKDVKAELARTAFEMADAMLKAREA